MAKAKASSALAFLNGKPAYTVANGVLTLNDAFRSNAVKAANDVHNLIQDKTPIALNLWAAYKETVMDASSGFLTRLEFFRTFDDSIPVAWGKQGSPARKTIDAHIVLNKLTYLTMNVGRRAAGDIPKRDPKVAAGEKQARKAAFVKFAKAYKLTAPAIKSLVILLGFKSKKTGSITKAGTDWLKAAGLKVTEE